MVLIQWLERGLGQLLAPDANYKPNPDEVDTRSSFWQTVAPDPNFEDKKADKKTPALIKSPSQQKSSSTVEPLLGITLCSECQSKLCASCRKLTISGGSTLPLKTPQQQLRGRSSSPRSIPTPNPEVLERVMSAAQDLAEAMASPPGYNTAESDKAFRICASSTKLEVPMQKRLRKSIIKNPALLTARCTTLPSNHGYTLLQVAAFMNNLIAAQILFETCGDLQQQLLTDTNLQGKTAYHIAAEQGHAEMLDFIMSKHIEVFGLTSPAPTDLNGRTPLGVAVTSSVRKARENKSRLMSRLYTPTDLSVLGSPLPVQYRWQSNRALQATVATAEIPGKRIFMEDYTVIKNTERALVFAVCDGHADAGHVSKFVAGKLVNSMADRLMESNQQIDWQESCREICMAADAELKATDFKGGSVAILVAVLANEIVVANVGDCRCLLIRRNNQASSSDYSVRALSKDHKPNIPEEVARIEKAGLEVMEERFEEDGQEVVIHKVVLSDGNRMACSRSFGDFEYKANAELDNEEQAVTAVPEVIVQERCPEEDAFLVAACDGVWDVMTNEDVAQFVTDRFVQQQTDNDTTAAVLPSIGDDLLQECLSRGSIDNMSVVIVGLSSSSGESSPPMQSKALDFTPASSEQCDE